MIKSDAAIQFLKWTFYCFGGVGVLFTILPFLRFENWWIRIGDFPRLQIAAVLITASIAILVFFRPEKFYEAGFLAVLLGCAVYQFYCILPYTAVYPNKVKLSVQPEESKTIKLLISNVQQDNDQYQNLPEMIRRTDPDVILLAEPDQKWLSEVSEIKENYPFYVEVPLDNAYGMALYSRFELIDPQIKFLIESDIPSIHSGVKLVSGDVIKLYCLHPRPPFPTESTDATERDLELLVVAKEIAKQSDPAITAGDLNDVAWSRTTSEYLQVSGMLDPRMGRGMYNSFHADHWLVRFPLDHVFHTSHFKLVAIERQPSIGSDHFPILITLELSSK